MTTRLRIAADTFRLVAFWAQQHGFGTVGSVAVAADDTDDDLREYLVTPPGTGNPDGVPVYFRARTEGRSRPVERRRRPRPGPLRTDPPEHPPYVVIDADYVDSPRACLVLDEDRVEEIDEVVLVGSGMRVVKRAFASGRSPTVEELRSGRWSRTIGGLRGNYGALRRLQRARFAVVGCGRNGALMAAHLAAVGVTSPIALIDDDIVEAHNADAMGLDPGTWNGVRKVDALEHALRAQNRAARIEVIPRPAAHPQALRALSRADVILSTVDHGEARLIVATAGAAFLRPVIDVGSGIGLDDRGAWRGGCDVRLTLPGECLVCFGGVTRADRPRTVDWWRQRQGSLRSLNSIATGVAQWMIERLFSARRVDSTWVRIEARDDGRFVSETRSPDPMGAQCPVCRRMAAGWRAFEGTPAPTRSARG